MGVGRLAFSSDGRTLASSAADRSIRLWNVATGRQMLFIQDAWMLPGDEPTIADAYYSAQAGLIAGDRWLRVLSAHGVSLPWNGGPGIRL